MKLLLATFLFFAFFTLSGGKDDKPRNETWCIARPSASDVELTNNIYFACQTLKSKNCTRLIEKGGQCWEPKTLINHASVVMNVYYVENGRNKWNCDFKGTGLVTISNPSYGTCIYE